MEDIGQELGITGLASKSYERVIVGFVKGNDIVTL